MNNIQRQHSKESPPLYWVGIDGGGTHCRASIYDINKELLGRGLSGSANPVNGVKQTTKSITDAITQAIEAAKLTCEPRQLIVGAGLAGLHLPNLLKSMQKWQHPYHSLYITTDIHTALLGAHQGADGAVIILGTGFSALGLADDMQVSIGGYGFPINATCSGSWFGLELIKAVLLDSDEVGPVTSMTQATFAKEDIVNLANRMNNAPSYEFAKYAPLVFEHAKKGDDVAIDLIKQGATFINKVIQTLLAKNISAIAFVGSVAPHMQEWLKPEFKQHIVRAKHSPEFGAVIFANQSAQLHIEKLHIEKLHIQKLDVDNNVNSS